ncbi:MAG: pentapeptide repeat-containing protein [Caldilineaceae bacterium]|nr:pentapeptide repeat-containing protein [Caldilineaceae bacterium]
MKTLGRQREFNEAELNGLAADQEEIRSRAFYDCTFTKCSFREAKFAYCKFNDCTFVDCDLSLAAFVDTSFRDTRFERSLLVGVNWTLADWPDFTREAQVGFLKCTLDYATFIGLKLHKLQLVECSVKDVDFSDADLTEADFGRAVLAKSQFRNTNLTKANFEGAAEYQINPTQNNITKARFAMPEAMSLLYGLDIVLVD